MCRICLSILLQTRTPCYPFLESFMTAAANVTANYVFFHLMPLSNSSMPKFVNLLCRHRLSVATLASDVTSPSTSAVAQALQAQQPPLCSAQPLTHAPFAPHYQPQPPRPPSFQHRPLAAFCSTGGPQTHSHAQGNVADAGGSAGPDATKQQQQEQKQLHHPLTQQQQQQQQQQQRQRQVPSATACLSAKPVLHSFGQRQTGEQCAGGQQSYAAASTLPAQTHSHAAGHNHLHAQASCQRAGHIGEANVAFPLQGPQLPGQLPLQLPAQLPAQLPQGQQGHLHPQSSIQHPSHDHNANFHPRSLLQKGQLPPAGKGRVTVSKQAAWNAAAPAQGLSAQRLTEENVQLQPASIDDAAAGQSVALRKVQNSAQLSLQLKQQVSCYLFLEL